MKPSEKVKAQKILRRVESGDFDENDIDSIFMILRAYSYGNKVFREVADFVAHNDKRNKGLTTDSLEGMYLIFKYMNENDSRKNPLDIMSPFPLYIKKLMKHQVDKCEDVFLKEKFNLTKQRLRSKIDKSFSEDKKNKTATLKKPNISENTLGAINYLLSIMVVRPAFDQEQIISEFLAVLKANKLGENLDKIFKYSNKITVCVILLLHKTNFEYSDGSQGYCKISCYNTCIPYKQKSIIKEEAPVEIKDSFGNLEVLGHVEMDGYGKNVSLSYSLVTTNLPAESWCDDEMFTVRPSTKQNPNDLYKAILFDEHLYLNDNDKIGIIRGIEE